MALETITGNLLRAGEFEPGTFQTASEITKARIKDTGKDTGLRGRWFYTANLGLGKIVKGKVHVGISGRPTFEKIAGSDLNDFYEQVLDMGHFALGAAGLDQQSDIAWISEDLIDRMFKRSGNLGYTKFYPNKYEQLPVPVRPLLEVAFGDGQAIARRGFSDDFKGAMEMFSDEKIKSTRIYVIDPNYIRANAQDGQAVAQACWLGSFGGNSNFDASDRFVGYRGCLRGVLSVAEGDDASNLVTLEESKLHSILEEYVPPIILDRAKKEMANHYK